MTRRAEGPDADDMLCVIRDNREQTGDPAPLAIRPATLEEFSHRAASAAQLVSPLGDHVDALVHGLTEDFGDPHLFAAPVPSARSTFALDAAPGAVPEHVNSHVSEARLAMGRTDALADALQRYDDPRRVGGGDPDVVERRENSSPLRRLVTSHARSSRRQLTVDTHILEVLLEHATSAAHLVGHLDDCVHAELVGPLGDHVDAIVHDLTELLGEAHLRVVAVPDARPRFEADDVTGVDLITRDAAPTFDDPEVFAASCIPWLSLPPADERREGPAPAHDSPRNVAASAADEPTRPRTRRLRSRAGRPCRRAGQAAAWLAGAARPPAIEAPRRAARWIHGATIIALIALLGVIAVLSACIATAGAR